MYPEMQSFGGLIDDWIWTISCLQLSPLLGLLNSLRFLYSILKFCVSCWPLMECICATSGGKHVYPLVINDLQPRLLHQITICNQELGVEVRRI